MKKLISLFPIIFTLSIISCSENPVNQNYTFKYPTSVGSRWDYTMRVYAENIRPDSIKKYFYDFPLEFNGYSFIEKDTVLNNIPVIKITDHHREKQQQDYDISASFYSDTDSGLYMIAYISYGGGGFPDNPIKGIYFRFNNKNFTNLCQLSEYINNNYASTVDNDTLLFEYPPVKSISYPITPGYLWTYRDMGLTEIYKKYIKWDYVYLNDFPHLCIKTKLWWNTIPEMEYYTYLSVSGLLKKEHTLKDILVTDLFGNTLGYVDYFQIINATNIYIPNN